MQMVCCSQLSKTDRQPIGGDMKQGIALVANGHIDDYITTASILSEFSTIIAIDGGLEHCHRMGIEPSEIIGDLDSSSPQTLQLYSQIPVITFPADKDETDLELGLRRAEPSKENPVTVFGALGRRTDHTIANLFLLARYPGYVRFASSSEEILALKKTHYIKTTSGQTISLLPLAEEARGVTTQGLKWELQDATLTKNFFSISNICLGEEVRIVIQEGILLAYLNR